MYPKPVPANLGFCTIQTTKWRWKGEVQTLSVGLCEGEYKYYGQYRLTPAAPLTADEYRELSAQASQLSLAYFMQC